MLKSKFVKDIGVGIISSIVFLIIVQPLLGIIWKVLKNSSFSLYEVISAGIIKQSALGEVNMSDSFIFLIFMFAFAFYSIKGIDTGRAFIRKVKKSEEKVTNSDEINQQEKVERIKDQAIKRIRFLMFFSAFNLIIGLTFGIYLGSKLMISKGLIAEFNQKINAISPYLSDLEIKQLKSKWALMQNVKDFNSMNKLIDGYAKQTKIILPKSIYFF